MVSFEEIFLVFTPHGVRLRHKLMAIVGQCINLLKLKKKQKSGWSIRVHA